MHNLTMLWHDIHFDIMKIIHNFKIKLTKQLCKSIIIELIDKLLNGSGYDIYIHSSFAYCNGSYSLTKFCKFQFNDINLIGCNNLICILPILYSFIKVNCKFIFHFIKGQICLLSKARSHISLRNNVYELTMYFVSVEI